MSPPSARLKLTDPQGSAPDGNAALGQPSLEDSIAERAQLDDGKRRVAQLERSNAELEKRLDREDTAMAKAKGAAQGKVRHIAHAEGWKAICTAPDFCKVGKDVVAFNSFATLENKHTASSNVKARGTAVYRKGDVIKNVQGDAGKHVVSGTSLGSGHVKILDGHDNVKVNGIPVARHDSRCLINCDAEGAGGAQGRLVTEQKSTDGGVAPPNDAPAGERTTEKLDALKKARAGVAGRMLNLDAADEYVNFQQSSEMLDGVIAQISGTPGTARGYAAQVARGLAGFGKDFVMGVGELAYEGIKAAPKLVQLTQTQSGKLLAQLDAQILAENIKLGNITPGTVGQGALNIGKAVVKPVTDPWAKGDYLESVTRGATEVGTLGIGWLKGSKAARTVKAAEAERAAQAAKAIELGEAGAKSRLSAASKPAANSVDDGVHVKGKEAESPAFTAATLAERRQITQLSNDAASAEKSSRAARIAGNEPDAAKFDAIAKTKIDEARKILWPYIESDNLQAILDRLDVASPKDGAYFWSGWADGALERSGTMARDAGGITLESTPGGRVVNGWDQLDRLDSPNIRNGFWPEISEKYAVGAEGRITVVQSDAAWIDGGGKVWKTSELPQLIESRKVTEAIMMDLNGNTRSILSFADLQEMEEMQTLILH